MEQFDNFIRKHAQQEIEVPDGLSWEEMHIPLPNNLENKKPRLLLYLLSVCTLGLILGLLITSYLQVQEPLKVATPIDTKTVVNPRGLNALEVIPEVETPVTPPLRKKSNNHKAIATSKLAQKNTTTRQIATDNNTKQAPYTASSIPTKPAHQFSSKKQQEVTKAEESIAYNLPVNNVQTLDAIDIAYIKSLHSVLEWSQEYSEPTLHNLDLDKSEVDVSPFSLHLSYGYAQVDNKYSQGIQASSLNTSESSGHGFIFNLGTQYRLNKSLFAVARVSYQRHQSIFRFTEDLGTIASAVSNQSVRRYKHIYHNNSIEYFGIQFGIGSDLYFGPQFGAQVILSGICNYQLRANGRSLSEDENVLPLENVQFEERWTPSLHASLGLFWDLENSRIVGNVGWQQSLRSRRVFTNSDLVYSPRLLALSIGIERSF